MVPIALIGLTGRGLVGDAEKACLGVAGREEEHAVGAGGGLVGVDEMVHEVEEGRVGARKPGEGHVVILAHNVLGENTGIGEDFSEHVLGEDKYHAVHKGKTVLGVARSRHDAFPGKTGQDMGGKGRPVDVNGRIDSKDVGGNALPARKGPEIHLDRGEKFLGHVRVHPGPRKQDLVVVHGKKGRHRTVLDRALVLVDQHGVGDPVMREERFPLDLDVTIHGVVQARDDKHIKRG